MKETNKKIKVLHIVADPMSGALLVAPIARRQAECGYSVEFACSLGEYVDKLKALGFPVTIIPLARQLIALSHLSGIYQLWQLIRRNHYDVVHTHNAVSSFLGRIAAALAGTPIIIYHLRGSRWDSPSWITREISILADRIAGYLTTHTFTINSSDAKEIVRLGIAKESQVTCLHCGSGGVDTQRFDRQKINSTTQELLRKEFSIQKSDFVAGFIGRIVREKGVFELIEAFGEVINQINDAKLLIIGGVLASDRDSNTFEQIKEMISMNEKLKEKVIFTGFRSEIPELIYLMDVVILPSYYQEGFGMVLAEAASMAKPAIATNSKGGREAIISGKTGLLVSIGDAKALKDAILQLALNPELRNKMGKAARQRAVECFDETIVFEKIKKEYDYLLEEKGLQ